MRCRGKFYCGEGLPIHRPAVLHVAQLVGFPLSIRVLASDDFRIDGLSQRAYSSHGYSCEPSTPGLSSLYVV